MKKDIKFVIFSLFLLIVDAISISISYMLSYLIRFKTGLFSLEKGIPSFYELLLSIIILVLLSLIIFIKNRLYELKNKNNFSKILESSTLIIITFMGFTFLYREISYSRILFLLYWPISIITILIFRNIGIGIIKILKLMPCKNILYIGEENNYKKIRKTLEKNGDYLIKRFVHYSKIDSINFEHGIDEIVLDIPKEKQDLILKIINQFGNSVDYKIIPTELEIITRRVNVEEIDDIILLNVKNTPLRGINIIIKRIFDFLTSLFLLIILSPLSIIISILIKIDSKGPIIYKQERVGQDKKKFTLYKFRSMINEAEKYTGPIWAEDNDPRVTKVGKWLRNYYIDELPQLFNVFKGDMSLVGPRPERSNFVEKFKDKIPRYLDRHVLKSGMTGWAQVNGYRGNTSLKERIKYDLYYIENWSVFFDIKILLKTLKQVLFRK